MIKIRRVRRPVVAGFFAERASGAARAVSDRRDPRRDERVVRVVGVIEVPYLKPIVRRRGDSISCSIVWPAKLEARVAKGPAKPRKTAGARVPAPVLASPVGATESSPVHGAQLLTPRAPALSAFVCGAAAACGFVLGRLATDGPAMFAAWLGAGLALLITFVATPVALGVAIRGRSSVRGVAVLVGALALTAMVMAGAGVLRPA